eukprot:TRINITY_DN56840_c0_g1_i1.p2 TRINITY_DN56840_c0_g1~~TRINITY_DN56840_c0_g1_i1.p2  ORF type:complete len:471 (+),score=122.34 TRINITY_DN56840_c0_g1_i1:66-1415(+)
MERAPGVQRSALLTPPRARGDVVRSTTHLVDTRRSVQDKYTDVTEDLTLVSHVGNDRYGEEPRLALGRLKQFDEAFHTSIASELSAIEQHLRRHKLEREWEDLQGRCGEGDAGEMQRWVDAELAQGRGGVRCRLPRPRITARPSRPGQARSRMAEEGTMENRAFVERINSRDQGNLHVQDRVCVGGRAGTLERVCGRLCEIVWADDGTRSTGVELRNCTLLRRGHPAAHIIAAASPARSSRPASVPRARSAPRSGPPSRLSALFSMKGQPGAPDALDFLRPPPPEANRRVQVRRHREDAEARDMRGRSAGRSPHRVALGGAGSRATARFMEVHTDAPKAQVAVLRKKRGEPLALHFDPESLCVCDGAAQLHELRRMRVTHVALGDAPVSDKDRVATAADLRQRVRKAQGYSMVTVRAEPWTNRKEVERRQREFRAKLATTWAGAARGAS